MISHPSVVHVGRIGSSRITKCYNLRLLWFAVFLVYTSIYITSKQTSMCFILRHSSLTKWKKKKDHRYYSMTPQNINNTRRHPLGNSRNKNTSRCLRIKSCETRIELVLARIIIHLFLFFWNLFLPMYRKRNCHPLVKTANGYKSHFAHVYSRIEIKAKQFSRHI